MNSSTKTNWAPAPGAPQNFHSAQHIRNAAGTVSVDHADKAASQRFWSAPDAQDANGGRPKRIRRQRALRDSAVSGTATASQCDDSGANFDVLHIVGWWESLLDRVLRLKVPRALCGELLGGDPDHPDPTPDSPMCPRCTHLAGPGSCCSFVPGHWLPVTPMRWLWIRRRGRAR
jgi:hypothetical protein